MKLAAITFVVVGFTSIGFGVSGFLNPRVRFCDPATNPCTPRILDASVILPEGAKRVEYIAGDGTIKLLASLIGFCSFAGAAVISRKLADQELIRLGFKQIEEEDILRRYATRTQAGFEVFYRKTNFDAAEEAYSVIEPYQALLEGETLDDITTPSNKIAAGSEQEEIREEVNQAPVDKPLDNIVATASEKPEEAFNWIKGFLSSTCLVWGNQGSGKSWFVRYLTQLKQQKGYKVIVFDPNSNRSEWQGVELYNSYSQIEEKIAWYVKEVMQRYEQFGKTEMSEESWRDRLWQNGRAVSIICEEMTTYSDFIADKELLIKFVKVATTLSRKQEMPVTFITHNNTQSCMGDIKGLANLISRMQQIQLIAATDPKTAQPIASGKALIKLDGSEEWQEVTTPRLISKIKDFRSETQKQGDRVSYLERTYNLEFDLDKSAVKDLSSAELPPDAQKIITWAARKHAEGIKWITPEQCRASGCIKDAKTADIRKLFETIANSGKAVLNERGDLSIG